MVKDSLKFFQAWFKELVSIGGENLPKSISTKLGSKLGTLYKERGFTTTLEGALSQLYKAIKGSPNIRKIDENTYDIEVRYSKKFCPIGGLPDEERGKLFQGNICIPFTASFLSFVRPEYKIELTLKNCLVESNNRTCHYLLKMVKKEEKNTLNA